MYALDEPAWHLQIAWSSTFPLSFLTPPSCKLKGCKQEEEPEHEIEVSIIPDDCFCKRTQHGMRVQASARGEQYSTYYPYTALNVIMNFKTKFGILPASLHQCSPSPPLVSMFPQHSLSQLRTSLILPNATASVRLSLNSYFPNTITTF